MKDPETAGALKLTPDELRSSVWLKLRAHLTHELTRLRARNDGNFNAEETARIRGQIAQLKMILKIGDSED